MKTPRVHKLGRAWLYSFQLHGNTRGRDWTGQLKAADLNGNMWYPLQDVPPSINLPMNPSVQKKKKKSREQIFSERCTKWKRRSLKKHIRESCAAEGAQCSVDLFPSKSRLTLSVLTCRDQSVTAYIFLGISAVFFSSSPRGGSKRRSWTKNESNHQKLLNQVKG